MSAKDEKQKRKALLNSFKQQQRDEKLAGLPLPLTELKALFDYLDEELSETDCGDTLRLTKQFLQERNLPVATVTEWLGNHGGYCDCEVLANVEEKFEDIL
ncbi:DUF2695 domain-containing protein [Hymenobacter cavernae]|uniref:DUF2695 domain-containing protein n=1 Tax=Hymenobacter cavernae TaxID=2044852 RepID=A0ABQ1UI16_9BACT|nr:DUF2695 domain-containing protein [Hymenobacter cavernae]GGF16919.1 hypothetical protein GCM10011383_30500 [Hymenobacter cavernae]